MVAAGLAEQVVAGDLRALARAATLIEAQTETGRALLKAVFAYTGRAMIAGITGPPGAGKSTLVNCLIRTLRADEKTVGVIAIDPSSPFSHGALLGDRVRMQEHHADHGVFIRSMATRGKLGGLAQSTLDTALLMDAAGRDVVLIETVGVGQDEVEIAGLADVTVVVLVPGLGDDIQASKAGIMEVADVFAINKADLPGTDQLEEQILTMQSQGDPVSRANAVPVCKVTSTTGEGVPELSRTMHAAFVKAGRKSSRTGVWAARLKELLREDLLSALQDGVLAEQAKRVAEKIADPYTATAELKSRLLALSICKSIRHEH